MGITATTTDPVNNVDTANKVLTDKVAARDASTKTNPGRLFALPDKNTLSGWETTWTAIDKDSMDDWVGRDGNKANTVGALYLWWAQAAAYHVAVAGWWTAMANSGTDDANITTAGILYPGGDSDATNGCEALTADDWTLIDGTTTPALSADSDAGCKTACSTVSNDGIWVELGAAFSTKKMAKTSAAPEYCHTAWYEGADASGVCKIRKKTTALTANTGSNSDGAGKCNNVGVANTSPSVFLTAAKAVYAASPGQNGTLASTRATADTAMEAQAALEKDWLQAYYTQQYWAKIVVELTPATADSEAFAYTARQTTLSNTDAVAAAGSVKEATDASQAASNSKDTVTTALAGLNATAAAADAVIADLGKRIRRHDAEIAELMTLVNDDGTSGTLDVAAAKRLSTFTAYVATDGTYLTAEAAKNDAAAAVAAADPGPEGALVIATRLAEVALSGAVSTASGAADDLTNAIADIQGLRDAVTAKSGEWDTQDLALKSLQGDVAGAEGELKNAKAATLQATINCEVAAYDTYRSTLKIARETRAAALASIKLLLE
jgi:hypothetical protein